MGRASKLCAQTKPSSDIPHRNSSLKENRPATCEPTNPAPPVIRIRFKCRSLSGRPMDLQEMPESPILQKEFSMASKTQSITTTDHDQIRNWAEERGAQPACVKGTGEGGDIGMLRLEFPESEFSDDRSLQEISWNDWFDKFDERNLALAYQDTTASGEQSNFNKLVSRDAAKKGRRSAAGSQTSRTDRKSTASKSRLSSPSGSNSRTKTRGGSTGERSSSQHGSSSRSSGNRKSSSSKRAGSKSSARQTGHRTSR
jgi:hypothetical protein